MAKYIIDIPDGKGVLIDEDNNKINVDILYDREEPKFCRCEITPCEEPVEEKPKRWRNHYGYQYYFLDVNGKVNITADIRTSKDDWKYNSGNYFRTNREAKEYRERLLVYNELKTYAEPDDAVWNDCINYHWHIFWDIKEHAIGYNYNIHYKSSMLHFPSKEAAEEAVKAVGEERVKRFYLEVNEVDE